MLDPDFFNHAKKPLQACVYDYLKKSGADETAQNFYREAGLNDCSTDWISSITFSSCSSSSNDDEEYQMPTPFSPNYSFRTVGGANNVSHLTTTTTTTMKTLKGHQVFVQGMDFNISEIAAGLISRLEKPATVSNLNLIPQETSVIPLFNDNLGGNEVKEFGKGNINFEKEGKPFDDHDSAEKLPEPSQVTMPNPDGFLWEWWSLLWEEFSLHLER
ncbi:hypothetical protein G9A89_017039 [Geosiphon pyriformis]|nr:hypothetical protein G9A89_017039 [Geosiphon pyriformis]